MPRGEVLLLTYPRANGATRATVRPSEGLRRRSELPPLFGGPAAVSGPCVASDGASSRGIRCVSAATMRRISSVRAACSPVSSPLSRQSFVVWSACNRTYTAPSSALLRSSVPLCNRDLTASGVMPRSAAASCTE